MSNYAKMPRGKRVMRVLKADTNELVFNYATNEDLVEELGFTKSDLKNLSRVLNKEVPSIKGYKVENIGVLRDL
jgi:hypothetical protein